MYIVHHLRHLSQKDYQIHAKNVHCASFTQSFPERLPNRHKKCTLCTIFVIFPRKMSNITRKLHIVHHLRHLSQKDVQIHTKNAHCAPITSSFPERCPISYKKCTLCTNYVIFPRKIANITQKCTLFTNYVIFPRKMSNITQKMYIVYHFRHLSQKDYQIHAKTDINPKI